MGRAERGERGTGWRPWLAFLLTMLVVGPGMAQGEAPRAGDVASAWPILFHDVAQEAGVVFQTAGEIHDPAGEDFTWPGFPEVVGAGACWADFTGDGLDDLYIANQRYNDLNPYAQGYNELFDPTNGFYVNLGGGTFKDRTEQAGVESRTFDFGCSGVDTDGDGHVDLLVYGFGHIKLYRNNGDGTFTDATQAAGLDVATACLPFDCFTSCSAWADYNGNGWLDLFVCTFVDSHMADDVRGPGGHVAQLNFLFRNNGDGTFTEVAAAAGVEGIAADALGSKSWGAVWLDANLNGWPDLYVANDMTPNEFYWNNGDGTFTRDDEAGLYDARAGMGVASGDTTGSGYPDVYITHYSVQHNGFYENRGDGTFKDRSGEAGLGSAWLYVGWGTHFVDLDRDGRLDIVAANGHLDWRKDEYGQETLVYRQLPGGDRAWADVTNVSGPGAVATLVSRGAAFADFDLDGNMDALIGNNANQSAQLLKGSGNTNNWIYVQPVQPAPNHQAIGARVIVETGGVEQVREIQAGASFLSQNSLLADFGVAQASQVDRVTVVWPDGAETVLEDLPVNRVVRIDRETGSFETDTLSPLTRAMITGDEGSADWFRSAVDVDLVAEDRAVGPPSGVAATEFLDGEGVWRPYAGEVFHYPAVQANHTLRFRSVDHAGNVEPMQTQRIRIDLEPPSTEPQIVGTPASNDWWLDAKLGLAATDALSGVARIDFRVHGGPWARYLEPLPFGEASHLVEYFATDRAGNAEGVQEVLVQVDPTPPEVSFLRPAVGTIYHADEILAEPGSGPPIVIGSPEAAGIGGDWFTVRLNSSDDTSGVDRLTLWLNDVRVAEFRSPDAESAWLWNTSAYPAGTYLLQAVAQDRAGNVAVSDRVVVLVPATEGGLASTLFDGPSLYPVLPPIFP